MEGTFIGRIRNRARRRRHDLFVQLASTIPRPATILDVGGSVDYWKEVDSTLLGDVRIVLLNVHKQEVEGPFESVIGDARDLSRYGEHEFPIVFSNSVLGHVGSFQEQKKMAKEIARVGKHFFVQTPNHRFPLDWRTLVPFFHFFPTKVQAWCFERFKVGSCRRAKDRAEAIHFSRRVRNVKGSEVRQLFPCAIVVRERVLGFTKSFIAHSFARRGGSTSKSGYRGEVFPYEE